MARPLPASRRSRVRRRPASAASPRPHLTIVIGRRRAQAILAARSAGTAVGPRGSPPPGPLGEPTTGHAGGRPPGTRREPATWPAPERTARHPAPGRSRARGVAASAYRLAVHTLQRLSPATQPP